MHPHPAIRENGEEENALIDTSGMLSAQFRLRETLQDK